MISIVMPFYKKYKEFVNNFEKNNFDAFNKHPDMELIISVDDPTESEDLLSYLEQKTMKGCCFSVKVLLNNETHEWRCPSKAINQGIKQATYEKITVMSPETLVLPDSLSMLERHCNDMDFSLGIIKHIVDEQLNFSDIGENFAIINSPSLPYGSICFTKQQALHVGGYDESYIIWGGDDDDFRNRLVLAGFNKKIIFSKFIHVMYSDRAINFSKDKEEEKKHGSLLKKIHKISNTTNFKVASSLISNETVNEVFKFEPT